MAAIKMKYYMYWCKIKCVILPVNLWPLKLGLLAPK